MGKKTKETNIKCEHTELVDPATLKDNPRNPNKHPQKQIDALAKNIKAFGWRHPVIVSKRSGLIVAGHCRKQAALKLGCKAPVDLQDFTDDNEELAVLLADNVIPELAEIDHQIMEAGRKLLEQAEIDLELIGFQNAPQISDDFNLPDILIDEKIILDKVTLFIEKSIKTEVMEKIKSATVEYGVAVFRIMQ